MPDEAEKLDPSPPRAKSLPIAFDPPPLVPARMINEALYCERLMVLEWVQGEFAHNVFTLEGTSLHARADAPGGRLPDPKAEDPRPYQARAVSLSSERLGITAKIDIVEGEESGVAVPIEYKRGRAPDLPEGAYLPERAQLAAHVLLLREHGYECDSAEIYFAGSRKRVSVLIDADLLALVERTVVRTRELARTRELPPPLRDSPKCNGCSLVGICLPDETVALQSKEHESAPLRRLHPARDDRLPLYVTEHGARVGVDGDELVVKGKEATTRARLPNTSHVSLFGNAQISTQALRRLFERGIGVSFLSAGGWLQGRAEGFATNNVDLKIAHHRAASDVATRLRLARAFVEAKIWNCRTMLRRNNPEVTETVLFELQQLSRKVAVVESAESLLGIEGTAARTYFGAFSGMLRESAREKFDLDGRNRRPPKDPVNALLSFAYSLLARDLAIALGDAGLDPLLGFYHRPRFGRPALALDMMEELRPILADSVVVTALNTNVVTESDFITHGFGVSLTQAGRRAFVLAHERRMDQEVTHPTFGYKISWRRVLEVQARLLGRFLLGEIPDYPQLRPR
ncbi:CRISPR-associated endonuclease Cas1 [soil metagenome]